MLGVSSVVLLFALSGVAEANPPDTKALAAAGVHIDWPLTAKVGLPAARVHQLTVGVRSRRPVTVALVRVDAKGRGLGTVKRKTLRNGTFEAIVSRGFGTRFALRLDVDGKRSWSRISLTESTEVTCEHGTGGVPDIALAPAAAQVGGSFAIRFGNAGRCPLEVEPSRTGWETTAAGRGWSTIPLDCSGNVLTPAAAGGSCDGVTIFTVVGPGAEYAEARAVPGGLAPGHYRLNVAFTDAPPAPVYRGFDVTAGPVASTVAAPAHPPDRKALRALGVEVEWPLGASVRLPARRFYDLAVPVRSARHLVTVSLVQLDAKGRDARTIKSQTLRTGTVDLDAYGDVGTRLALRLEVAGKRYWSAITVSDDSGIACGHVDASLPTVAVEPAPLRSGQPFTVRFGNAGTCVLGIARWLDVNWERPTAVGGWERVRIDCATGDVWTDASNPTAICDSSPEVLLVDPGERHVVTSKVPGGLVPGRYRVTIDYGYADPSLPLVTREVDVLR